MSKNNKASKKLYVGDNRITLDAKHKEMMKYFRDLKKSLPKKKHRLQEAGLELDSLNAFESNELSKEQIDAKFNLSEEIKILKQEIEDIENNKEENEYYLNTASLLYTYYENLEKIANEKDEPVDKPVKKTNSTSPKITDFFGASTVNNTSQTTSESTFTDTDKNKRVSTNKITTTKMDEYFQSEDQFKRADILDKFMKKIDPTYFNNPLYEENVNLCDTCLIERTLIRSEGILLCEECMEAEYIVICSDKPSPKDKPCGDSYYAYKRINHFAEWLSQIQAKETTEIPQEVFDQILVEIKKERLTDLSRLSYDKMRHYLKKLKLNKYYEHIPYIVYRLSGIKPPTLGKELEEKLKFMFKEIQQPFEEVRPDKRKNFLSYSYVLYKFFELLGLDDFKKQFSLLKSRTKLHEQDKIWRDICRLTKWQYIPSI